MASPPHLDFEREIAELETQIQKLTDAAQGKGLDLSAEIAALKGKLEQLRAETFDELSPMERVQVARHPRRPYSLDYIQRIAAEWIELHGDRAFRDDEAIVGGWGTFAGRSVMFIGHQKGRDMKENLRRNFGMPHPEGYRKALRLMRQAEKFHRPIITLIDTPGAYPGLGAEERGQAEAIAMNLREMARLRTPVVSAVIGEGGSGGALALGVSDRILMLENSVYSVITPEGCAAILWRSADQRERAAEALKLTSGDLLRLGIADEVVPEPAGGAHADPDQTAENLADVLDRHLRELEAVPIDTLLERRWAKFEAMGHWVE
ncbi:MAG: acetyl-CoA carboxylase carboxyltransferase subunit alpha [Gemmatimonadota bacterium]